MQFDFWNNPIVVSAMRLKYRRSSPGILASVWALGLLSVGVILYYAAIQNPFPVARTYLIVIFGLQFGLCAIIAMMSTSSSVNAEVTNRTLDFQRIVSLSPQAILIGKMLGEPATSYFLAMTSLPFAVLCWAMGGAGFGEILFLYLDLATFILMAAALGLINSLTPPTPGATRQRSGAGMVFIVLFIVLPQLLFHAGAALTAPVVGEVVQLVTPIGSLVELWHGNAWRAHVTLWGLDLPSLLAGPVVQLAVAAWIIAAMTRRLKNPLDPAVTKRRAYATVAVLDLLLTGICFANWRAGAGPWALVYGFCVGHLVVCLLISFVLVPRHTAVVSWIWRRPRRRTLREFVLADRTPVTIAAVLLGLIGPLALGVGFILPMALVGWPTVDAFSNGVIVEACAATVVVVAAILMLHQLLVAIPKRGGPLIFLLVLLVLNVVPPITASILDSPAVDASDQTVHTIASLSPAAYFVMNMSRWSPDVRGGWLIAAYACLGFASYRLLHIWMRRQSAVVQRKLETMGVAAYPAAAQPA